MRGQKYDRHRRIRTRYEIGGHIHGCYLPLVKKTWGEVFYAKMRAKEIAKFFNKQENTQ